MSGPARARPIGRRPLCVAIAAAFAPGFGAAEPAPPGHPDRRWAEAAEAMRRLALSWGDQPYGAVLVTAAKMVGEGPSRVVRNADPDAHAELEAIRDAQRRLDTRDLTGSVLYSTSRPCRRCEQAAAEARVGRMYFGVPMNDAGAPRP